MKEFLDKASRLYYEGTPILSDAEFDSIAAKYDYNGIGHNVTNGIPHLYKMYSLDKVFSKSDLPANYGQDYICTPKLDGAAVSLVYSGGHLALGLTRGDGNLGRDITEKLKLLVPDHIPEKNTIQITGEVVAPAVIHNSRNYSAGSLNLKDMKEFSERLLTFVAYDFREAPEFIPNYTDILSILSSWKFNTVDTFPVEDYPTDGWVYRINSNHKYEDMGYTAHHPRGSVALKEQATGIVTKLIDVVWQIGKSGVISPVGILQPVDINGAIVSRATLHNIQYIESLGLEIGCNVEVIRSGEIIPRILRRVD